MLYILHPHVTREHTFPYTMLASYRSPFERVTIAKEIPTYYL